jgi:hypothetical protein
MADQSPDMDPDHLNVTHVEDSIERPGVRHATQSLQFPSEEESETELIWGFEAIGDSDDVISITSSIATAESSSCDAISAPEPDDDVLIFCCALFRPIGTCLCDY